MSTNRSILNAFFIAIKYASIFGGCIFIFFFASIAMVQGNGTAPWITHASVSILDFTVKLLGISSNGSVFTVVFFWAFLVFVLVFMFMLLRSKVSNG